MSKVGSKARVIHTRSRKKHRHNYRAQTVLEPGNWIYDAFIRYLVFTLVSNRAITTEAADEEELERGSTADVTRRSSLTALASARRGGAG